MGFLETASITLPDAEGETYVVISMQPLSDIRNGRATVYRHFLMCGLPVKLRGCPEEPDERRGRILSSSARGMSVTMDDNFAHLFIGKMVTGGALPF